VLRRRIVRQGGIELPRAVQATWSHPLCGICSEWLAGVLLQARRSSTEPLPLFGSPVTNGRPLALDGQCQICRSDLGPTSAALEWFDGASPARPWLVYVVCAACEGWIGSLADDGRSARGRAGRDLDGAYGGWLHPNLREITVAIDVGDAGARETIEESCTTMGVAIRNSAPGDADVLLVEVSRVSAPGIRADPGSRSRILLAPITAHDQLVAALESGASDWLTIPVTPQQVSAALSRARRLWRLRLPWDAVTALPTAVLTGDERPALDVRPAPGVPRFELAWLLKRFVRGYDEVVVAQGTIVIFPRVVERDLGAVAARLERVLHGRCTVVFHERAAPRSRFEAAG
jgi:hypothetical protein